MEREIIETERLILRKLKIEDAEEIFENWTNDEEVSKYTSWHTHDTAETTREWIISEIDASKNGENFGFGIVLKETGELIGSIGAYFKKEDDNRYEIGYVLAKKCWRKGYATEAVKGLLNYLTDKKKINRYVCRHAKLNPASGKVMRKAGFIFVKDEIYVNFDKTKIFDSSVYYLDK